MAEVFLAKTLGEHDVSRFVAIKRILPTVADDPEFVKMFIDEANLSVQLTHANIAQTFELGRIGRSLYIAMEYVSGVDLRHVWERSLEGFDFPLAALVYIVGKLCEGLDYAHRKQDSEGRALGVVHRDISPQNVMIAFDGQVKVIDFGIAKAKVRASQTRVGILKGKFAYMSPEQVGGLELDQRSDVFSVGILLYELLTRMRLFKSDSDFMTLERVKHVEMFPPSLVNTRIPPDLERIILKTLARDRDERTGSAEQLADMLQNFAITSGETCSARELSALLAKAFPERVAAERERLSEYENARASEAPPVQGLNTGAETFASVPETALSSAQTQIMALDSMPLGDQRTRVQGVPVTAQPTRVLAPMGRELSDTPNLRRPRGPQPMERVASNPDATLLDRPPPQPMERVPSGPKKPQPMDGVSSKSAKLPAVMDDVTSKVEKQRAIRATQPPLSFAPKHETSRESMMVWAALLVAAVVVVLAFWIRGQLNSSARLQIDVEPPSAELLVNERRLGQVTGAGFEVQPGDVLVEVRAPGYCPWFRSLHLAARETFSTRVTLAQRGSGPCP